MAEVIQPNLTTCIAGRLSDNITLIRHVVDQDPDYVLWRCEYTENQHVAGFLPVWHALLFRHWAVTAQVKK